MFKQTRSKMRLFNNHAQSKYTTIILTLAVFSIIKLPLLLLPASNDEYIPYLSHLINYNGSLLSLLHPSSATSFEGHPTLIPFFLTGLIKLTGGSIICLRIISLIMSTLGCFYVYLIGLRLKSHYAGFFSAMLLYFFPGYFIHSTLFFPEIYFTPFAIIAFYFLLQKKWIKFNLIAPFLALSRESSIAFSIAIAIYIILSHYKKPTKEMALSLLKFSSPILYLAIFFISQKAILGSWSTYEGLDVIHFNLGSNIKYALHHATFYLLNIQHLPSVLLYYFTTLLICILQRRSTLYNSEKYALFFLIGTLFLFFSCFEQVYPRYYMPAIPFLALAIGCSIFSLKNTRLLICTSFFIVLSGAMYIEIAPLFKSSDRPIRYSFTDKAAGFIHNNNSLSYISIIQFNQLIALEISKYAASGKTVAICDQTLYNFLSNPFFGYTTTKVKNLSLRSSSPGNYIIFESTQTKCNRIKKQYLNSIQLHGKIVLGNRSIEVYEHKSI